MIYRLIILLGLNGLWTNPQPIFSQPFDCEMVVPPFQLGNLNVQHIMDTNVDYLYDEPPIQICWESAYSSPPPWIQLGKPEIVGSNWNPFRYRMTFDKPVQYMEFLILVGATGYMEIDFGAENFVFETPNCGLSLVSIYSCHALILEDTIYLGVGNTGTGWFSVTFDEPVMEFTISGKGGGNGSGFQICSNSIQVAPLWAGICASSAPCNQEAVTFTAYGSAPPYALTYLLNGAPYTVQTTGANENVEVSVPMANGTYEYELISITDGNGQTATISCNNRHTVVVNNEPEVVIPNVFTPNNDGVNDWFGLTSNAELNGSLVILNRWGNVVYERSFVTSPGAFMELWDGTSTGSAPVSTGSVPVSDGVYFYRVNLSSDEQKEEFVGFIDLRR
jgi:gliding motility-associated-like protein